MSYTIPAVILQSSGPNAVGMVRGLARQGVPVIATDHSPNALAMNSRYPRKEILPDPLSESERFVEELLALGRRVGSRPVLFATHDEAIAAIAAREDEVRDMFRVPWSTWDTMQITIDKSGQHDAAKKIGFPVPGTVDPEPHDDPVAAVAAAGIRYPVVLKPRYTPEFKRVFGKQVLQAKSAEELAAVWADAAPFGPQVQEVIPGGDDCYWTLGSYRSADMTVRASFTGRKLLQWPPGFGTARAAEARWDPDFAARCHALLDELKFHGISQVEVKRDPRDGKDYLIEVNPRSWMWNSLATHVGVNLTFACYLDAIGEPRTWAPGHRSNVRWVNGFKHLTASILEIRRRNLSAKTFLSTVRPPLIDGVFDIHDPKPAFAQYGKLVRRFRKR